MYDLGQHFKFDLTKASANPECVFKGDKYRITVLTERLVRLEYNTNGMFEDYPTELIWYRNFPKPEFQVNEIKNKLYISTRYFDLEYTKGKNFKSNKLVPDKNLKIKLKSNQKIWYYNNPEVRKFETISYNINDKMSKNSLYSLDGFASIDDSKNPLIMENGVLKKRDNTGIDIYVFLYGNDYYSALNDYFKLTSYPPLIPRYALGNWWDKDEFYSEETAFHIIKKFEENNIPISVFILNNWQSQNSYEFNEFYKNPKPMIDYIKSQNIKFGLQIRDEVEFKQNSSVFNKFKDYIYTDKNGNIPFNLFDAKTMDAYFKLLIGPLTNIGVDIYSLESFDKKNMERSNILKHYLYFNCLKDKSNRPLISAYNSSFASHRYPIIYSGKINVGWDSLKKIPLYNLSATNCGISFLSSDVGGSNGGIEDSELFTRFVELGVFSPILRLGSESGKYYKREPWKWGLKTKEITTNFLNLRYKLIPYLYTESYKYFKYGKPLIEPLYYRDPGAYDDVISKDEYYFGSTFLVSPITTKKDHIMNKVMKKIYIPEGIWFDFFTGKQYKGSRRYTSFYKDEDYPVFVKAGAIIPMSLNKFNDTSIPTNMEIQVFPGNSNAYSIYEDDGKSNNYLNGEYLITNIEYRYEKDNYSLTVIPVSGKSGNTVPIRNYKLRFRNTKSNVQVLSYEYSNQVNNKFYKEGNDLIVEVENVKTSSQLTVIVKGKDLEIDALRIIGDDITEIISDLPIKTSVKEIIDGIMFSSALDKKKKRIEIKKLSGGKFCLEKKYINLLLKLLEYVNEV